jgi:hypothetical protein
MLLRNIYYDIKPALPLALRLALRRTRAKWLRRRCRDRWPISEKAGRAPNAWPGWPGGAQFAFVLTHDVEERRGLERCRRLAGMEMELGFRSAFNFVPEGDYETPPALRRFLVENGFEVGVHDLHHDGKLYRTRRSFLSHASRINGYIASWQAAGFRSAFMFHNLQWLQDLDILYDGSTFDTDPFEPQPDGVDTIFPFLVTRGDSSAYVELPCTLPQDSTMFIVLQETTIDIWRRKLDWIAARGGLALLNVHPDYISFDGPPGTSEYSPALYQEFLDYVSREYRSRCWHALPREVARHIIQQADSSKDFDSAIQYA